MECEQLARKASLEVNKDPNKGVPQKEMNRKKWVLVGGGPCYFEGEHFARVVTCQAREMERSDASLVECRRICKDPKGMKFPLTCKGNVHNF